MRGPKKGVNILWVTEKFYVAKVGRVKILWKLKYGGQNSIFFPWNPWSKFYVPWKGGSKFYIFFPVPWKRGVKTAEPTNQLHWRGAPPPPPPPGMGPAERVPWGHWLEQLQKPKINTTVRAFQTKHVSDPACPIVRALRSAHFAFCINTTRVVITALLLQGHNMAVMAFQITGPSTGSGSGLAPNRRQAITWTNETSTRSHWRRNHL